MCCWNSEEYGLWLEISSDFIHFWNKFTSSHAPEETSKKIRFSGLFDRKIFRLEIISHCEGIMMTISLYNKGRNDILTKKKPSRRVGFAAARDVTSKSSKKFTDVHWLCSSSWNTTNQQENHRRVADRWQRSRAITSGGRVHDGSTW